MKKESFVDKTKLALDTVGNLNTNKNLRQTNTIDNYLQNVFIQILVYKWTNQVSVLNFLASVNYKTKKFVIKLN